MVLVQFHSDQVKISKHMFLCIVWLPTSTFCHSSHKYNVQCLSHHQSVVFVRVDQSVNPLVHLAITVCLTCVMSRVMTSSSVIIDDSKFQLLCRNLDINRFVLAEYFCSVLQRCRGKKLLTCFDKIGFAHILFQLQWWDLCSSSKRCYEAARATNSCV